MIAMQERNITIVPVDHVTDCMDLFELATGSKGLSNDKTQRIVVMSIREDRLCRRIRNFFHVPTAGMIADGLTKPGTFYQLLRFATTGTMQVSLKSSQYLRMRESPPKRTDPPSESEIIDIQH